MIVRLCALEEKWTNEHIWAAVPSAQPCRGSFVIWKGLHFVRDSTQIDPKLFLNTRGTVWEQRNREKGFWHLTLKQQQPQRGTERWASYFTKVYYKSVNISWFYFLTTNYKQQKVWPCTLDQVEHPSPEHWILQYVIRSHSVCAYLYKCLYNFNMCFKTVSCLWT